MTLFCTTCTWSHTYLYCYLTWLMFSLNTITCCYLLSFACYYLLTLHSLVVVATVLLHYIFNPRLPEYQFVIGLIIRNSIQRKVLLSVTLTIRNIRGRFCRRLNHQRINPKKCTLIKFWQSGKAEADFVVDWTIRESIQINVRLSNFDNREEQRPILS